MTKYNPKHYKQGKTEVWDFIHENDLCYFKGNIIKYVARAGKKHLEPEIDDLLKAKAYLDKLIAIKQSNEPSGASPSLQECYEAITRVSDSTDYLFTDLSDR